MSRRSKICCGHRPLTRFTVRRPIEWSGFGLHTGQFTTVTVSPAPPGHGLAFTVALGEEVISIPATPECVSETDRRTELRNDGASISTVEHLLAALFGSGVDDARIHVSGNEIPLLDGSAKPFADGIASAGLDAHGGSRDCLVVDDEISLEVGEATYRVTPSSRMSIAVTIEFDHPLIGIQTFGSVVSPAAFASEIAAARTFGFIHERAALDERELIRGATPENVLILTSSGLWEDHQLRWPDECARHKALDLLGDLALLGSPVLATIRAVRPSHRGNVHLARIIADVARPRRVDPALTV